MKGFTYQPNDNGNYPEDTIPADTQVSDLDDEEVTEIVHELETYKLVNEQGVQGKVLVAEAPVEVKGEG